MVVLRVLVKLGILGVSAASASTAPPTFLGSSSSHSGPEVGAVASADGRPDPTMPPRYDGTTQGTTQGGRLGELARRYLDKHLVDEAAQVPVSHDEEFDGLSLGEFDADGGGEVISAGVPGKEKEEERAKEATVDVACATSKVVLLAGPLASGGAAKKLEAVGNGGCQADGGRDRGQGIGSEADPPGHPGTITVATLGATTKEVSVVAGQTVRDLRRELCVTLGPRLGPCIKLINGDHVLQDNEGLDGVTDVTAVRDFVVSRKELKRTIKESKADMFRVEGMGEDIIIRKAPAGAQTGNFRRPQDVPLYHMRNTNNEELILGEFGLWGGPDFVSPDGIYFFGLRENWTRKNVGAHNLHLWVDFLYQKWSWICGTYLTNL